jgi:hypothetical protein
MFRLLANELPAIPAEVADIVHHNGRVIVLQEDRKVGKGGIQCHPLIRLHFGRTDDISGEHCFPVVFFGHGFLCAG